MAGIRKTAVVAKAAVRVAVTPVSAAPVPAGSGRSVLWWALGLGAVISLGISCAVASNAWVVGSIDGGWVYQYGRRASAPLIAGWILWSAVVAGAAFFTFRLRRRRPWLVLIVWILFATGWQATLRSTAPFSLEALFTSDQANAFYGATRQHSASETLRSFNRVRAKSALHVQSNMPGKLLLIHALRRVTERTDMLPWLLLGLSNLGAILMFLFVRDFFCDDDVGLYAAILYLFLPARNFFFPILNTITPLVILTLGWLIVRWLATGSMRYALLAGVALYGVVLFEPLPLVTGLLFLVLMLAALHRRALSWDRAIFHIGVGALAFVAIAQAMHVVFDFDIAHAFRSLRAHAMEFNDIAGRPYAIWIGANLWEFAFGLGFCQAIIMAGALAYGLSARESWSDRLTRPLTSLTIGLIAVLAATDLIGINRGEVTRLWIFMAALFQIPAAYICATVGGPAAMAVVIGVTALHTAVAASLIRFVVP